MDLNTEYWQEIRYLSLACLTEPDSLDGAYALSALLVELNNNNNAFKSISLRFLSVMQSLYLVILHSKLLYNNQSISIHALLMELNESLALLVELDNKMHQSLFLDASFRPCKVCISSASALLIS